MSYEQENGYTPETFDEIIDFFRLGINENLSTTYTPESFVGTGWYKFAYSIAQKVQSNEIKTAEIFQELQEYINIINARIQRPSVSYPGLLEAFLSDGWLVSVKPPVEADAGKIYICVDVDNAGPTYAAQKLSLNTLIKNYVAGGIVSMGTESSAITLTNGQEFTFSFNLPNRIDVLFKVTAVISENNLLPVPTDTEIRQLVFDTINARYQLGYNFEPQRYYNLDDAPWAESIVLEWSSNAGVAWHPEVYDADYRDLFTYDLEDIQVLVS